MRARSGLARRRNALDGLPLLTVVVLSGTLFVSVLRPPWRQAASPSPQKAPAASAGAQSRVPHALPALALQGLEAEHLALEDGKP